MAKTKPDPAAQPADEPEAPALLADPVDDDRIVLKYTGPKVLSDAPARDLSPADVARMAYLEALRDGMQDGIRPDPRQPDQGRAAEIVTRLIARGAYAPTPDTEAVLTALVAEAEAAEAAAAAEASDGDGSTENPENVPADPATPEG